MMNITLRRAIKAAVPYGILVTYRRMKKDREERSHYNERFSKAIVDAKVIKNKKNPRTIISLTSYGARLNDTAPFAIASLLSQTVLPDKIILWLAHGDKPSPALKELTKFGIEIDYTTDIKSYKKLIPALEKYPKSTIITVDDDILYPPKWLANTLAAHKKHPKKIVANRARKIVVKNARVQPYNSWPVIKENSKESSKILPNGAGGILYPAGSLSELVFRQDIFMGIAPHGDDLWFWAMGELNGTKRTIVKDGFSEVFEHELDRIAGLSATVNGTDNNDIQLKGIMDRFPDLYKRVGLQKPKNDFQGSEKYWEDRYAQNGDSGAGSYGRLAEFKAEVINKFVKDNDIANVMEFGVGDGNQLLLAAYPEYLGLDVSRTAIAMCKKMFKGDRTKQFMLVKDIKDTRKAELTMSLDVLYHLTEENIFERHIKDLFKHSLKYVIIYAHDSDTHQPASHVKSRNFTEYINKNIKGWKLLDHIPNRYPYDTKDPVNTSWADFYIYERV